MMMLGTHVIKLWRTNQATIAMSSGEAAYYGMVEGVSHALGLKAIAEGRGMSYMGPIHMNADTSAAI